LDAVEEDEGMCCILPLDCTAFTHPSYKQKCHRRDQNAKITWVVNPFLEFYTSPSSVQTNSSTSQ
jgi:hypothetical protein